MLYDGLARHDFAQNSADQDVYIKHIDKGRITVVSWFGDLILASDNIDSFNDVQKMLTSKFRMKDIEKFNHFRGKRL